MATVLDKAESTGRPDFRGKSRRKIPVELVRDMDMKRDVTVLGERIRKRTYSAL